MPNAKVSLLCATAAAALALPAAASAQIDPGVNYDPGSPAGKEYAIPLVEGRSDAAGTTDQREGANIPFGVGIRPPGGKGGKGGDAGGAGKSDGRAGASGATGSRRAGDEAVPGARPGESREELAARIADAEAPAGTAARTILLAFAVLAPAAFVALLLWQRGQVSRTGRAA
jgi:hypothetical protein